MIEHHHRIDPNPSQSRLRQRAQVCRSIQVPEYDEPEYITVEKMPFHPLLKSGLSARGGT